MPCTKVDTDNDCDEGNSVVEARTVVCGLGVDPNKYQNYQGYDQRGQRTLAEKPVVKALLVHQLSNGYSHAKYAPDNDIEKAVHATIEPAKDNGDGEPVTEYLESHEDVRIVLMTGAVEFVECIEGDGNGIARVRGWEAVLQGSGS